MRKVQIGLIALGVLLLGVGGVTLLAEVAPKNYTGIVAWFAGAIILHDGVASFALVGVGIAMRRLGHRFRVPLGAIIIVQGSLVIGAVMALVVVPEIIKKSIGRANETLLPLDYGLHLAVFYAALTVATGLALAVYFVAARRQKVRPLSSQA
jgi:hypothetical protein